jgi:hypothetical protein
MNQHYLVFELGVFEKRRAKGELLYFNFEQLVDGSNTQIRNR